MTTEMTASIDPKLEPGWKTVLEKEFQAPYFLALKQFLLEEKRKHRIYPPGKMIFNAFDSTPFDRVKAVILGQDPYHGPGQAHGLCFSVNKGVPKPPSLINIFKELQSDLGLRMPTHGHLGKWAEQGVLLLNATLTVRANLAGSHQSRGWETFTDAVIRVLSERKQGLVFFLWGNYARAKQALIDQGRHHVLLAPHPSPLSASRGFFGCRHFSRANQLLLAQGESPVDWQIE